jgi:hypothetical protein
MSMRSSLPTTGEGPCTRMPHTLREQIPLGDKWFKRPSHVAGEHSKHDRFDGAEGSPAGKVIMNLFVVG